MADTVKVKSSTDRSKKSKPSPKNKNKAKPSPNKRDFYVSDSTPVAVSNYLKILHIVFQPKIKLNFVSSSKVQQESCEKLLETENGVNIYGVGPHISAAINLALQIERRRPAAAVQTTVTTSTVYSIGDLSFKF
jgi:uncharacterized protein YjaG (DUF416 family)